MFRALATLEGTLLMLCDRFDMLEGARRHARSLMIRELGAGDVRERLISELTALLPELRPLPGRLLRITNALDRGELGVGVRLFGHVRDRRFVTRVVQQVLLTMLGATASVLGVVLLGTEGGPELTPSTSMYDLFGYNLVLVAVILLLRALFMTFDRKDAP